MARAPSRLPTACWDPHLGVNYLYYDYDYNDYCNWDGTRWIYRKQQLEYHQQQEIAAYNRQQEIRHTRVDSTQEHQLYAPQAPVAPAQPRDPNLRVRHENEGIFVTGRVLRCCWMEEASPNADQNEDAKTYITTNTQGHQVYSKYRIFIVIRDNQNHYSTCLPVTTYGGRGVAKPGVVKSHHSIVYAGSRPPTPREGEDAGVGESGMRRPIRVNLYQGISLDPLSRINFNMPHPISHRSRVHDMGMVHESSLNILKAEWKRLNG